MTYLQMISGSFTIYLVPNITTHYQGALLFPLLNPAVSCVLSGMSTQAFTDENCALGSIIENISELERRQF